MCALPVYLKSHFSYESLTHCGLLCCLEGDLGPILPFSKWMFSSLDVIYFYLVGMRCHLCHKQSPLGWSLYSAPRTHLSSWALELLVTGFIPCLRVLLPHSSFWDFHILT